MRYGFDAAFCPDSGTLSALRELGYDFFFGYLGGRSLHVWEANDWRRLQSAGFDLAGYWVAPSGDAGMQRGLDEANACLQHMASLGMGGIVLVDVEDGAAEDDYLIGFHQALAEANCAMGVYGSSGTIFPAFNLGIDFFTILANWSPFPVAVRRAPPDFHVWQYGGNSQVDYNVARADMQFATLTDS